MNLQENPLPEDAPPQLSDLYKKWQAVATEKPPSRADFPYEVLVKKRPGLAIVESVPGKSMEEDLRFTNLGPQHGDKSPRLREGHTFTESMHARHLPMVFEAYNLVRKSGEPHYWEMTSVLYGATQTISYCRLLLPLFKPDGEFDCFLADFVWPD